MVVFIINHKKKGSRGQFLTVKKNKTSTGPAYCLERISRPRCREGDPG